LVEHIVLQSFHASYLYEYWKKDSPLSFFNQKLSLLLAIFLGTWYDLDLGIVWWNSEVVEGICPFLVTLGRWTSSQSYRFLQGIMNIPIFARKYQWF
jgi:hypothetical protein